MKTNVAAELRKTVDAAVASASFPGVFAPSVVDGLGPCVGGGAVNNAAIDTALEDDAEIEAVVVMFPTPADVRIGVDEAAALKGTALAGRVADMLVNERSCTGTSKRRVDEPCARGARGATEPRRGAASAARRRGGLRAAGAGAAGERVLGDVRPRAAGGVRAGGGGAGAGGACGARMKHKAQFGPS